MNRFLFKLLITITLFVFSPSVKKVTAVSKSKKPNILMILVDDLGYRDLSCNGGTDIQTPNIDKLFDKGITFRNFYANSTVCSPTRASLLTGQYPDIAGVPGVIRTHETDSWGYLNKQIITLPDLLKSAGYGTAIIGKWHLGLELPNLPNYRGFDYFKGFLGDMMENYWDHKRHGINYMRFNEKEINPEGHATDLFSDWAAEYINESKKEDKPFFLYLAYNAPHFPIQPPEEWFEKVKKREVGLSEKRAKNVAFVEHLDDGIGRVIDALKESGQLGNTIIVFSSDNGGHLASGASNGELRGGKQDMYEGGIKVPTCFVWPGKIKQKTESQNIGLTMDLYPTFCDIARLKINHVIDGMSLLPTILGREQNTASRTVYFMRREGGYYGGMCYYAARNNQYKLVQNSPFEPIQLFNLDTDPKEQLPLRTDSETYKLLKKQLSQHIRKAGAVVWQK